MEIVAAESTDLFIGTEDRPRQVVRVTIRGTGRAETRQTGRIRVDGDRVRTEEPVVVAALAPGAQAVVEVGLIFDVDRPPGTVVLADAVLETAGSTSRHPVRITVADPGWRMFMVSHFHYDPVWWNTQAGYTESWELAHRPRAPFQEPGLALVKTHLEMARRDPDYKFVLAELDYLKPYWDVYPEDRAYLRALIAEGRLELMGGTYNEPNTNLTSAESTIRNAIYGVGYQRDVLGGLPATAWQLDAFGHDPQFPAIMADAGLTSSSWARGPFHEWGPHWVRGPRRVPAVETHVGEKPRMQFATEFEWLSPSGHGVLTAFMANHYSAGWWMDSAATLDEAEEEAHRLFSELQTVAATRNVLLPVGTDYTPPNKWLTAIHRDWNARYVWPKFLAAIPREFFDAAREARAVTGRGFSPQTRDMNPIYTGKDVSFIDTKQAQRIAENTLLSAEKFATFASLLGARYPSEAVDKAWRQLLFGAHHDGITGSESDQVYLDLLGGWREAMELGQGVLDAALQHLVRRIDTRGEGWPVAVFNALSWSRSDIARVELTFGSGEARGLDLLDDTGSTVRFAVEAVDRFPNGSLARITLTFVAAQVPALGYRTYRAVPAATLRADGGWRRMPGSAIENDRYYVEVAADRGGALVRVLDKRTGKELLRPGGVGNELVVYGEYPNHPHFQEGPWHLAPDGTRQSSVDYPAELTVEESPIGRRISVSGPLEDCRRLQQVALWDGIERVEFVTRLDEFAGQDRLFRVRFAAAVEGGAAVSEVGNAVVGRSFGFPNVDVADVLFTLDNPAYNWFGLGATARVSLVDGDGRAAPPRAARAISVAEVVVRGDPAQDAAVRQLVVALVGQGVTATLTRHSGSRYGVLDLDSNLPDVRILVGGPSENHFTGGVLREADTRYAAEFERQLQDTGRVRLWVPAARPLAQAWRPNADLRGFRDLPVLIVAGADGDATVEAVEALTRDLEDAVIAVDQPAELDGTTGRLEDYTIAVLNRGIPGFSVEPDGSLYLSLMRSSSGWPSGVWINPPRRTAPDGSNFQFQHWTHNFEYALVGTPGDWRAGELVRIGHEYNNPLLARAIDAHAGELPAATSLVEVEPRSAVLTVVKPVGNPIARMAGTEMDPADGITLRLYESSGTRTSASIRCFTPLSDPFVTNILEEERRATPSAHGRIEVALEPASIVTVHGVPDRPAARSDGDASASRAELARRDEIAQPVFADYWMHNKGAAPIGYQPVTVQIAPGRLVGKGPFRVPVSVASERTDDPVAGSVTLVAPPGWHATPPERLFRLAPGAHLSFEASVVPAEGAAAGRYFVAARIDDAGNQRHEDVVTIDYAPDGDVQAPRDPMERSEVLAEAIARAMRVAGLPEEEPAEPTGDSGFDGELVAELVSHEIRLTAGERGEIRVSLRNRAASEIRGEVQVISPHETWPLIHPWTQGFAVGPAEERVVGFAVEPPSGFPGGSYWALVKVMYFGRLLYTEAVKIELLADVAIAS